MKRMGNLKSRFMASIRQTSSPDKVCTDDLPSSKPITETTDKTIVAAIDVGTAYSGYAYADKSEFNIKDSASIHLNNWRGNKVQNPSDKAPSVVLFDPEGNFHSFGYAAESDYMQKMKDNEHREWYCFRNFKMQLYSEKVYA